MLSEIAWTLSGQMEEEESRDRIQVIFPWNSDNAAGFFRRHSQFALDVNKIL